MAHSSDQRPKEERETGTSVAEPKINSAKDEILAAAKKLCAQPLQVSDPNVWGVLTAISKNAREQLQATNILLDADEHRLGRKVNETKFQVSSILVSGTHCKIYRKRDAVEDVEQSSSCFYSVFLKDLSSNGTYLNWERLKKDGPEAGVHHGDIISLVAPPDHGSAFAFVYREVGKSSCTPRTLLKRKTDVSEEEFISESKKLKGLGIGAPEGPISLDDVRELQRSNKELRKQLESHVLTIETLRSDIRAASIHHENELKELSESVSRSYLDKIEELSNTMEVKQKELNGANIIATERQNSIDDLKERLAASLQSRTDADEIIRSQTATVSELEAQLEEERSQRREEREKAVSDLKAALERARTEASEALKRQSDTASRQQREQQEVINKLQESDRESRLLVEILRSKLEDARENFVKSENKVRLLETQLQKEQLAVVHCKKKTEMLESEVRRLRKELESEKVAREEAWAKVSALELEMTAAIRELSIEKRRFQGARERIILRETQLRAFYSTTEEISALFAKQQEQLKAMQKTLQDEENCENTSMGIDLNMRAREDDEEAQPSNTVGTASPKNTTAAKNSVSDGSMTEKHNCKPMNHGEVGTPHMVEDTEDGECTSTAQVLKGFGSDIDGTAADQNEDLVNTERVLGTESQTVEIGVLGGKRFPVIKKCSNLPDETMQIDNDDERFVGDRTKVDDRCVEGDTEADARTIVTADLLASEVAGSWAVSTAPSFHGENESPRSGDLAVDTAVMGDEEARGNASQVGTSDCLRSRVREEEEMEYQTPAAASQTIPVSVSGGRSSQERRALNEMIEIVAPGFRDQFHRGGESVVSETSSDTEESDGGGGGDDDGDGGGGGGGGGGDGDGGDDDGDGGGDGDDDGGGTDNDDGGCIDNDDGEDDEGTQVDSDSDSEEGSK